MSFDRQLQSAVSRYRIYGDGGLCHALEKSEQGYVWNTGFGETAIGRVEPARFHQFDQTPEGKDYHELESSCARS
jgi:streptogramin lyase